MSAIHRRAFLSTTMAATALPVSPSRAATPDTGLKLGVATYSLRKFTRAQAIPMLKELGVRYLSIKEVHLPYKDTPEELKHGRKEFDDAGFTIVSGGVVVTRDEDEAALRRYFDYGRICRMPMLIMMPTERQLPAIDKLSNEYGIKVAIHNHGPEDKNFPTPESVYQAIRSMDRRISLCVDIGHTARTGEDPVRAIEKCADRMSDMHIKDLKDTHSHSDCEVGKGVLPIVDVLRFLQKIRFPGNIALEYEADPENPLPGMRASLAYMHGVVNGLNARVS